MHDKEIKHIILEVYFLFKKIITLTTSLAISLLSINGIYAQASILNNINSEAVNANYLEKKDLNTNIYDEIIDDNITLHEYGFERQVLI